jgi:(S)-sulfolactate dehydrogenase
MTEIVISEFMDQAPIDETSKRFSVLYDPELVDKPVALKEHLSKAYALVVRNRTKVDKNLLDAAPNLQVIGRLGVGLDNIDLVECEKRQITVCPATGANDVAVAEWVICCAMILSRRAFLSGSAMLAGEWPRQHCMGNEIGGKTLGLIGFGGIARETATRAKALGMDVIAFDPYLPVDDHKWQEADRCKNLTDLLQHADIISLHVPLTESTKNLITGDVIDQMKEGAIVINAARGGVVVEEALVAGLKTGKIGGAALDVFEVEPLSKAAACQFANIPNLILTPHIGGVTIESNVRVSGVTMDNVCKVLEAAR